MRKKFFELPNHLQNVLVTISDRKLQVSSGGVTVDYYAADVVTAVDAYSGGMEMPGRTLSSSLYRYSINGQEKTPEVGANTTTAEFWQYDARIVRRWNVDPRPQTYSSPYVAFDNNPIWFSDVKGDTAIIDRPWGNNYDNYDKGRTDGYQKKQDIGGGQYLVVDSRGQRFITQEKTTLENGYNDLKWWKTTLYYWSERPEPKGCNCYSKDGHWVKYKDDRGERAEGVEKVGEWLGKFWFKVAFNGASLFAGGGGLLARVSTEATGQFISNGGSTNTKDYNLTSLITSTVPFLNSSLGGYTAKNALNSFVDYRSDGYNGVTASWDSFKEKTIQTGVGLAFDYGLSRFQTPGIFDKPTYTRLRNLSSKPKIAIQFSQYVADYNRKSFLRALSTTNAAGSLNTAASNIVGDELK